MEQRRLVPALLAAACVMLAIGGGTPRAEHRALPRIADGGAQHGDRVEILRDEFGIPHVFAPTMTAAAYGIGYAQATDRLEELLKNYRRAEGTMADAFGADWVRHDYRQRLWQHRAMAERDYPRLPADVRDHIEAFQSGVKQYMREHPSEVPAWAPTLAPWQVVALARYLTWGWSDAELDGDLQRAGLKRSSAPSSSSAPAYRGSNAMIISARRTTVGAPIAIIDPQLSWYGEYRLYGMTVYGGPSAFSGAAIVGTPYPFVGHTRYASIAMTSGGPDTADVFEEEVKDGTYRVGGEWRAIESREETVGGKPMRFESTRHGPIVARGEGKVYSAAVNAESSTRVLEQLWAMLNARNLTQMKTALGMLALPPQNLVIGTVDGDAYYLRNGRVPVRPAGCDSTRPMPGADGRCDWKGVHGLGDLAQLANPPEGYLQNCNTSPEWIVAKSPLTPARFKDRPYLMNASSGAPAQRPAMVLAALERSSRVSVEQAMDLALLPEVYKAETWQARLRQAMPDAGVSSGAGAGAGSGSGVDANANAGAGVDAFAQLVLSWDRQAKADSRGALAYYLFKVALGDQGRQIEPPPAITNEEVVAAARNAADRLREFPANATYGDLFRVGRKGATRTFPVSGGTLYEAGMATPRVIIFQKAGNVMIGEGGQTFTQLVVLGKTPKSYVVMALGVSDRKDSPHFDDQTEKLYSASRMTPTYFLDRPELERHVSTRMLLQIEQRTEP
jgi:acyl-homoserine-lactone acylase